MGASLLSSQTRTFAESYTQPFAAYRLAYWKQAYPCQIEQDYLLIQKDHVLEDMLRRWGQILKSWRLLSHLKAGRMGMVERMVMITHSHAHAMIIKMIIITNINIEVSVVDKQRDMMILQAWFSPAFPIGAQLFAWSGNSNSGRLITDEVACKVGSQLCSIWFGRNDGLFIKETYKGEEGY